MGKKTLKYLLFFLVIPLIISLIITFSDNKVELKAPANTYDSMSGTSEHDDIAYSDYKRKSNIYVYTSVGLLVIIGVGTWFYLKKKGDF